MVGENAKGITFGQTPISSIDREVDRQIYIVIKSGIRW